MAVLSALLLVASASSWTYEPGKLCMNTSTTGGAAAMLNGAHLLVEKTPDYPSPVKV